MKQRVIQKAIAVVVSLAFFFALHFVVYGSTYSSLAMLIGHGMLDNWLVMEGVMLLVSAVLCANVYQVLINRFSVRFVRIETVVYCVLTFAIIMLKSRGIQGINLDFSDLYQSVIEYPASVLINLLLFVPVGAVVFKYVRSAPRAFGLALAAIVGMEALQYVLHLGICDVVDVAVNMLGFSLGYLTLGILKDAGFRVVREDRHHARIARSQRGDVETGGGAESAEGDEYGEGAEYGENAKATGSAEGKTAQPEHGRLKLRIILVSLFFGVLILLFIIGFIFYDYQEYVPFETLLYHLSSKTGCVTI
jgi:glycopeptide antibiotics resistance protein